MQIEVAAAGEYYADLGTADEARDVEDLRPLLAAVCRERFRRIDRFTELALLGSARCVQDRSLPADTGLYISSGFGSVANTVSVQRQMFIERRVPKPLTFINTLSNSAGYYVARNLGLAARNQFVSRDAAPLEAALYLATLDLIRGDVAQALVGAVDEASVPLSEHARRLGVGADVPLAEGSHWLLLRRAGASPPPAACAGVETLADSAALAAWFTGSDVSPDTRIWFADNVSSQARAACPKLARHHAVSGVYRSRTAGVVLGYLSGRAGAELITVVEDDGRFHVMRFVGRLENWCQTPITVVPN